MDTKRIIVLYISIIVGFISFCSDGILCGVTFFIFLAGIFYIGHDDEKEDTIKLQRVLEIKRLEKEIAEIEEKTRQLRSSNKKNKLEETPVKCPKCNGKGYQMKCEGTMIEHKGTCEKCNNKGIIYP